MKIEYHEDDIIDVVEGMLNMPFHYVDGDGNILDIPSPMDRIIMLDFASKEWIECVSQYMSVLCEYRHGELDRIRLKNRHGSVLLTETEIIFESGRVAFAKKMLDVGIVEKYIKYPDLDDAMHVAHCMEGDQYYDLIELPSGGHVPVPHVIAMHVGWETLVKIPLGKPRGHDFFSCPVCKRESFYAGVCTGCQLALPEEQLREHVIALVNRKDKEREEIRLIIKNDDWTGCKYIRAVEQSA